MPRIELVEYLWDQQVFIDDNAPQCKYHTPARKNLQKLAYVTLLRQKEGWAIAYETDRISERQRCCYCFYIWYAWLGLLSFLRLTGYSMDKCVIILVCYGVILAGWLFLQFFSRRSYFRKLEQLTDQLDRRYLLGELMPESFGLEDRKYRELIRKSNKSVIERIHQMEQNQRITGSTLKAGCMRSRHRSRRLR